MHRRVGVSATIAMVVALALSACGASPDKKSDDKPAPGPSSSAPASYEGMEVKETRCWPKDAAANDRDVTDYSTPVQVRTSKVRGTLQLRMSTLGGNCDHLFWAKFTPDASNTGMYIVSIKRGDVKKPYEQPSADNPLTEALTKGTYAKPGASLKACVRARGLRSADANCITARKVK